MNQDKVGKFISMLRKEKNMTQQELADKLNVTDRAIGNWENGRRMPDVAFYKPLCEIFDITINELISGEKIDYKKENKDKKKLKKFLLSSIVIIIAFFLTLFIIDVIRMQQKKPVLFSTWGFDYYPPISLKEEKIKKAIKDYLNLEGDNEINHFVNEKTFSAVKIYGFNEHENDIIVYAWIVSEKYYIDDDIIDDDTASSMPYKIILKKENDEYTVQSYQVPRDGNEYIVDMKQLFPSNILKQMDNSYRDGTIQKLMFDIQEQVKLYYHK